MTKILALITYDLKRIISDKTNIIFALLMPIGFYVLMSFMFNQSASEQYQFLLNAMIPNFLIIIISNVIFNIFGVLIVDTISTSNMVKYELLGISKLKFALTLFISTTLFETIIMGVFLVFVSIYGNVSVVPANIISSLLVFILIHLYQFGLVYFLTSLLNKTSSYTGVAMTIFMFQMFTGGLTFPIQMFPEQIQTILKIVNPMAIASGLFQETYINGTSIMSLLSNVGYLSLITIGLVLAGTIIYRIKQKALTTIHN